MPSSASELAHVHGGGEPEDALEVGDVAVLGVWATGVAVARVGRCSELAACEPSDSPVVIPIKGATAVALAAVGGCLSLVHEGGVVPGEDVFGSAVLDEKAIRD